MALLPPLKSPVAKTKVHFDRLAERNLTGPLAPNGSLNGRKAARNGLHLMREFDEETRELILMHSYQRPKGGKMEKAFRDRFIIPLGAVEDEHRNLHVTVGDNPYGTIFSCHTDSVHRDDARQFVQIIGETLRKGDVGDLYLTVPDTSAASCLGADDAAGCWLMVNMIRAGVPGHYVFHYGEESGGIGSSALNKGGLPAYMVGAKACIAFDRSGYADVITHQGWRRTASDAFAASLCDILDRTGAGLMLKPCDRGVYTDSAEYASNVPECTNISVGYDFEHTRSERLNISYLFELRDALIAADWSLLVIERDPKEDDYEFFSARYDRLYGYGKFAPKKPAKRADPHFIPYEVLVAKYPTLASEMLALCQISKFDFIQEIVAKYGELDEDFDEEYNPIYGDGYDDEYDRDAF